MQEQFYKNKYFYTDNREKIKQKLYLSRDKSYFRHFLNSFKKC